MKENKYIRARYKGLDPNFNVFFGITNIKEDKEIGTIEYYKRWKRYVFIPNSNTIWSSDCLEYIIDFLKGLNDGV